MRTTGVTTETVQFTFRVPHDVMKRVDVYQDAVQKRTGMRLSRAQAVVALLEAGLDVERKGGARP